MVKTSEHYYMGFICKCAEYGIQGEVVDELYKLAQQWDRTQYDDAIVNQQNAVAQRENLDIKDKGKAGTMLGRGFRRVFMGKDRYGQYQANLANRNIEQARAQQARDYALNQRGLSTVAGIGTTGANPSYMQNPASPEYNQLRQAPSSVPKPGAPANPPVNPNNQPQVRRSSNFQNGTMQIPQAGAQPGYKQRMINAAKMQPDKSVQGVFGNSQVDMNF